MRSCYNLNASTTLPKSAPSLQVVRTRSASLVAMNMHRQCCCVLNGVNNQDFDFFPISFLFYVLFLIFMCVLICINELLNYLHFDSEESIIDLLFGLSIKTYRDKSLFELHEIHLLNHRQPVIYVLDLVLICGIMFISIWESLFSFYRYYTTYKAMQALEISSSVVLKRFIIYAIIYSIVFIMEIAVYYYTFLVVVLLHLSFNIYCTWKFASFLIEEYKLFISIETEEHCEVISGSKNQEILNSVIFMKRTSIACCVLQSISLCLFVVVYEPTIIYFLPILWSISCSIFALNFIRNRLFLRRHIFRIQQRMRYKCICFKKKHKSTSKPAARKSQSSKASNANDIKEVMLFDSEANDVQTLDLPSAMYRIYRSKSASNLKVKPPLKPTTSSPVLTLAGDATPTNCTENKSTSDDIYTNKSKDTHLNISTPNEDVVHKEHNSPTYSRGIEYSYSNTMRAKKKKKALALLGIHEAQPTASALQMELAQIDVLQAQTSISKSRSYKKQIAAITPIEIEQKEIDSSTEYKAEPLALYKVRSASNDEEKEVIQPRSTPVHDAHIQGSMTEMQDLGEAIKSFKLFAKYGFLSNANINSAQQLKKYHAKQRSSQMYSLDLQHMQQVNIQLETNSTTTK